MDKVYGIFGALMCIYFWYADVNNIRFFEGESAGHTKPTGPGVHHK